MNKKIKTEAVDFLFEAILQLKDRTECYDFFEDVCTVKEILDISQRLEVAQLLREGKSYAEVNLQTGASTATICRVKKCLMYGTNGYETALNRLKEEQKCSNT